MLVSASFYVTQGLRHIRILESTFALYPQTDDVKLVDVLNTTWSQKMEGGDVDNKRLDLVCFWFLAVNLFHVAILHII